MDYTVSYNLPLKPVFGHFLGDLVGLFTFLGVIVGLNFWENFAHSNNIVIKQEKTSE